MEWFWHWWHRHHHRHHHYAIRVREKRHMGITAGSTGTFTAQLEDNGAPIALPSGSTFLWSSSDPNASLAHSADTLSVVVTVPDTDTLTEITVTASTTDPKGNPVSGSVTVPITPGVVHVFTVVVAQTA